MLVMCLGMPRSGSTLQYNVARLLLESRHRDVALGWRRRLDPSSRELTAALVPDETRVVKSHAPPPVHSALFQTEHARVLYVFRDLRGVAASLERKSRLGVDEILRRLDGYVAADEIIRSHPRAVVYRYEDVIADVSGAIVSTAAVLGVPVTTAEVDGIRSRCSIERAVAIGEATRRTRRLRHVLAERYLTLPPALRRRLEGSPRLDRVNLFRRLGEWPGDSESLVQTRHVSTTRGAPDAWRQVLSPTAIAAIERRHGRWLERHGYPIRQLGATLPAAPVRRDEAAHDVVSDD